MIGNGTRKRSDSDSLKEPLVRESIGIGIASTRFQDEFPRQVGDPGGESGEIRSACIQNQNHDVDLLNREQT